MKFHPGQRVLWQGSIPCQVVDQTDPKLKPLQRFDRPTLSGALQLVVAANGQLVWVRESELREEN